MRRALLGTLRRTNASIPATGERSGLGRTGLASSTSARTVPAGSARRQLSVAATPIHRPQRRDSRSSVVACRQRPARESSRRRPLSPRRRSLAPDHRVAVGDVQLAAACPVTRRPPSRLPPGPPSRSPCRDGRSPPGRRSGARPGRPPCPTIRWRDRRRRASVK